jgi:hypothetical protein
MTREPEAAAAQPPAELGEPPGGRNDRASPDDEPLSAQDARQGEIILRTPARRIVFLAGLFGAVAFAAAAVLFGFAWL